MSRIYDRGPPLGYEDFRLIRDLISDFCGISFGDDACYLVERRLRERLSALSITDFTEYYRYLRYEVDARAELERAVDILTTNETYFFREDYQLRAFEKELLPRIHEQCSRESNRRLALWSAGCSTGEEVYTLAMIVADSELFEGWDVRIFGNDISRRVLNVARQARYGPGSFRAMPKRFDRWLIEEADGKRSVHPRIRSMCHFGHLNLMDVNRAAIVGQVHAIFCRNVLIYFDSDSRKKVIESFYERLVRGGCLLLGHSESLLNFSTSFELLHLSSDLVYRKPSHSRSDDPLHNGKNAQYKRVETTSGGRTK